MAATALTTSTPVGTMRRLHAIIRARRITLRRLVIGRVMDLVIVMVMGRAMVTVTMADGAGADSDVDNGGGLF